MVLYLTLMKAKLLFREKYIYSDDSIRELVIWQLPKGDPERPHGLKYRLYYGKSGKRLVCYDNEKGKGDQKHYLDAEIQYEFTNVEQLVDDFYADLLKVRDDDE